MNPGKCRKQTNKLRKAGMQKSQYNCTALMKEELVEFVCSITKKNNIYWKNLSEANMQVSLKINIHDAKAFLNFSEKYFLLFFMLILSSLLSFRIRFVFSLRFFSTQRFCLVFLDQILKFTKSLRNMTYIFPLS